MQDYKMLVRMARPSDSNDILVWRNDETSRKMFFDSSTVSEKSHKLWFDSSLKNPNIMMYIGEYDGLKVGICRFDFDDKNLYSEVSINMNAEARGRGLAKKFLQSAIEIYLNTYNYDLIAKVKTENIASKKIFSYAGFELVESDENECLFSRKKRKLVIREVSNSDVYVLFGLLKQRQHSISHSKMPTFDSHKRFVESKPYLHWYLISLDQPIGTFYIQSDNSIGINIVNPKSDTVNEVIGFIKRNFKPQKAVLSKIPPYFHVNVPESNAEMKSILDALALSPIQITYKLNL